MQCPKCLYHADHVFTFETSPETGIQWVVERCPNCLYAGWPDNPIKYNDYLKGRKENRYDRRDIRGDNGKWQFGL